MPDFTPVVKAIVSGVLTRHKPLLSPASKTELALFVFIAFCGILDIFLLALALYQYLETRFVPFNAALVTAAVFFAAAILAGVIIKFISAEQTAKQQSVEDEVKENIHLLLTGLLSELEDPIRESPKISMAMAALAGLLVARRI